jgi:hypothetical protein
MTLRRSPWETTARGEVGLRTLDSGETDPQRLAGTTRRRTPRFAAHTHTRRGGNRGTGPVSRRRKGCRGRYLPRDGYTTMKFGWLGIFTFGRVCAFISSVSPMIPLR